MPDYNALFYDVTVAYRALRRAVQRWERQKERMEADPNKRQWSVQKLKTARTELDKAVSDMRQVVDKL